MAIVRKIIKNFQIILVCVFSILLRSKKNYEKQYTSNIKY